MDEGTSFQAQQQRKMLLTLILLLVALTSVVVKDRQFWFGSDESASTEDAGTVAVSGPAAPVTSTPAVKIRKQNNNVQHAASQAAEPSATVTTRTAVPPLDVEVVSGDVHRTVRPGSNGLNVQVESGSAPVIANSVQKAAAVQKQVSANAADYPLLAKQMKVQGSVELQALVGVDGLIKDLRVISGPPILASAARQAVREWKFKPYLQNGHAVETLATITVNLTINVLDNSSSAAANFYSRPAQSGDSGF